MSAKVAADEVAEPSTTGTGEKVEITPVVAMGDGDSMSDVQAILESDVTSGGKIMDSIDETVTAACEEPGIFLILWARRAGFCSAASEYCVMVISIIIQLVVPAIIVHASDDPLEDINHDTDLDVKITAFALSLYLVSTYTGTMNRINAYGILMSTIPGPSWTLALGMVTLYSSILLTTYATFALFRQDPRVKDILLNCVALNFLPEADVQLVSLLKSSTGGNFGISASRLNKLMESWPETKARKIVSKVVDLTMAERMKQFPLLFSIDILDKCLVGLELVGVVAIAIVV